MITATKRKYPRCSGARRFQAYFVPVTITRKKVVTEKRFWTNDDQITTTKFCVEVTYYYATEKGKRGSWVPSKDISKIEKEDGND